MSTMEHPVASSSASFDKRSRWCLFLLDHLSEFATLAWYLVADGNLVEEAFLRSITQLEQIPFDEYFPARARDIVISQAIAVLADVRQREHIEHVAISMDPGDLPDLCRLDFMLRVAVLKPEDGVARP